MALIFTLFLGNCSKNRAFIGEWSKMEKHDGDIPKRILYFGNDEEGYMQLPHGERWPFKWGSVKGRFYCSFDIGSNSAFFSLSESGNQRFADRGGYDFKFGGIFNRVTD